MSMFLADLLNTDKRDDGVMIILLLVYSYGNVVEWFEKSRYEEDETWI